MALSNGPSFTKRRGVEDLVVTHMLRRLAASPVPVAEGTVTAALTRMRVGDVESPEEREALLARLLRTATVFIVSIDDVPAVGADLMDAAWEPWDGLPPLPFPRLWIECSAPQDERPVPFPLGDSFDSTVEPDFTSSDYGIGIVGDEGGWTIVGLREMTGLKTLTEARYPWDDDADLDIAVDRLEPDASSHYPFPAEAAARELLDDDPLPRAIDAWRAILLVQVIDVLGSRHVSLDVPRPHRRAHERQFGTPHPKVYFVDLRQAGEAKAGKGDRQYHHRWLVRGHWRTLSDGRRTWVRPYIKGPAGAPWRGRPIYVDRPTNSRTRGQ